MTDGRYADAEILQCTTCDRLLLQYAVEYEAFSKSGRRARGEIDAARAATISPGEPLNHLASLTTYLYGGSYFDGESGERFGPLHWDLLYLDDFQYLVLHPYFRAILAIAKHRGNTWPGRSR